MEAADDQLREIKKLRRQESKSLKPKGNEIQYKFNLKLRGTLMGLNRTLSPTQLTRLNPRCKKYELADNEEDGKKVWPFEVRMHSNRPLYF